MRHRRWWVQGDAATLETAKPEPGKHIHWDHGYLPHQAALLSAIRNTDGPGTFEFEVGEVTEPAYRVIVENHFAEDGSPLFFEVEQPDARSCVLFAAHFLQPGLELLCRVERPTGDPQSPWQLLERWRVRTTGAGWPLEGPPPWRVTVELEQLTLTS
jgi:hypothetical protein